MASRKHRENFLLITLLVFVMVVVLVTSGFFYFTMLSEGSSINAHVFYEANDNSAPVIDSMLTNSSSLSTNNSNITD